MSPALRVARCHVVMILSSYGLMAFSDIILGRWVRESQDQPDGELSHDDDVWFASVYGSATLAMVIGVMLGSYRFCWGGERVSNTMHRQCIEQLMFAPFQCTGDLHFYLFIRVFPFLFRMFDPHPPPCLN